MNYRIQAEVRNKFSTSLVNSVEDKEKKRHIPYLCLHYSYNIAQEETDYGE